MDLFQAVIAQEHIIRAIETEDAELENFLFTLGCYAGEPITVISRRKNGCVIAVKDSRYHIDRRLAQCIHI